MVADTVIDQILNYGIGNGGSQRISTVSAAVIAYFNIFCGPSAKYFPDGRNVHLTQRRPEWWNQKLKNFQGGLRIVEVDYVWKP